jgi:hypothetical protein
MIDPADLWSTYRPSISTNEVEAMQAAAANTLNDFWNHTSLSAESKDELLNVIHKICNISGIKEELMLPKSRRKLESIVEQFQISKKDVEYHVFRFSSDRMLQLSQSACMVYGYIPVFLQSILLDRRNPPESFYFNTKLAHKQRSFYDQNGTRLKCGPEFMVGTAWDRCNESVPTDDGVPLTIVFSSDGTITQSGTRIPVRVSIGNQATESRIKDSGTRTVGLLPVIGSRTPKGTGIAEKMSATQKQTKSQIQASAMAHMLVHLDEKAKGPVQFLIQRRCEDGSIEEVKMDFYLRILVHIVDKKEEVDLLGLNQTQCPRCQGVEKLRSVKSRILTEDQEYPYMCILGDFACGTTPHVRTIGKVLRQQVKSYFLETQKIGDAKQYNRDRGIKSDVEAQLLRLSNLYPGPRGPFACFATDMLHVWGLGVAPKVRRMIENYIFVNMKTTTHFKTREDLRHLFDGRVAGISSSRNWVHFNEGYYEAQGTMSSTDGDAMLSQLLFVYIGDTTLIPRTSDRKRLLKLHHNIIRINQELRSSQWYSESDLETFYAEFIEVTNDFKWLHEQLGDDNIPGHGLNIPKYHDWLNSVKSLEDFGGLFNVNTSPFERMMKSTKEQDRRTVRSRGDDHALDLFQKVTVSELNRATRSPLKPSFAPNYTSSHRGIQFSLASSTWCELKKNLFANTQQHRTYNMKGPPLPTTWCDILDAKLEYIFRHASGTNVVFVFA